MWHTLTKSAKQVEWQTENVQDYVLIFMTSCIYLYFQLQPFTLVNQQINIGYLLLVLLTGNCLLTAAVLLYEALDG